MVTRLWRLVEALQARRRGATVQQLVETLGASRATVYRDLGLLQEAGVPITHEAVNGEVRYGLARDALPALRPSALQVAALLLARQLLGPLEGSRLVKELDGLIASRTIEPGDRRVHVPARAPASTKTLVETIDRAMRNGRRLRIQYRAASTGRTTWRIVEPAGLRLVDNHLYLVAWDPEKISWRTFKVVRLLFAHDLDDPVGGGMPRARRGGALSHRRAGLECGSGRRRNPPRGRCGLAGAGVATAPGADNANARRRIGQRLRTRCGDHRGDAVVSRLGAKRSGRTPSGAQARTGGGA